MTGDRSIAEVLGVAEILRALAAGESGDASEEHFTTIGSDWDIEERSRAQLDRLGVPPTEVGDAAGVDTPGRMILM